jgi:hypothetical protein
LTEDDLKCQPNFARSWPLFHCFLSSLNGPIVLIAHNGLRFDFRILLAELNRYDLLQKYPFPENVFFFDSYSTFLDLDKVFHDEVHWLTPQIDWKQGREDLRQL